MTHFSAAFAVVKALQAYYTVFDKEKRRISFAPLKGC